MKKFLTMLLAIVLTAAIAVGGTVAYLTQDLDTKKNVFTVGDIDISLDEETGVIGDGGDVTSNSDGASYNEVMPGDYLEKKVTVTNEGRTDAYVAVTVKLNNADKINNAIDEHYEALGYTADQIQDIYDNVFDGWGLNYSKDTDGDGVNDAGMRLTITGDDMPEHVLQVDSVKTIDEYWLSYANNWFSNEGDKDAIIPFDGYYTSNMDAYELCYTYYMYLPAGESTTLFNGLNIPAEFDADQLAMFDGLVIDIEGKAIQADNIKVADKYVGDNYGEAKTAFATLAGVIDAPDMTDVDAVVTDSTELDAALKSGADTVFLKAGTYNIPDSAQRKTLTIKGEEGTVINVVDDGSYEQCDYSADGSTITFENVTIVGRLATQSGNYRGYARMNGTYNNCTIIGEYTLYGTSNFDNCTFTCEGNIYNIWTWGAKNVTFNDCTFNSDGKSILVYNSTCDVAFNNCVFNDNGGLTDLKAAIETGKDNNSTYYNIYVNDTIVNGYEINDKGISTGSTLWANKNSMDTDHLNVVVDGVDVY